MSQRRIWFGAASLVTVMLFLMPGPTLAAGHGGGGGHGAGGHGGSFAGGGSHGGGGGWHGGGWGHYGETWHGHDAYYGGYYPWFYGNWTYPSYGYYYQPGYYPDSYYYPGYYPDPYDYAPPPPPVTAHITVRVPADAKVWFADESTTQQGAVREFESPELTRGRNYSYDIRARWREGNREVEQTRHVAVRGGEDVMVDFTARADGQPKW
jgi:uncharacterized protein (TIGR03000 family)